MQVTSSNISRCPECRLQIDRCGKESDQGSILVLLNDAHVERIDLTVFVQIVDIENVC